MKKNILSIAILVFGLSIVNAQTGNVGVNTPNPQETLHINGTFRLDNSSKGVDKILVSDANGTGTWKSIVTGGTVTNVTGTSPINVATGSTTPVVSLANSGVTPGTYNGITVDAHGLVTSAVPVTSAFGSLTTNGTSGPASLTGGILNIPNYTYTLPIATTTLGGVKNGGNVVVNPDGTMTAPAAGGNGTVTSVSSTSGTPVITTSVANATTTPAISLDLAAAPANTYLGNNTGTATKPVYTVASALGTTGPDAPAGTNAPLVVNNGTSQLLGATGATLKINNTSPLWNANKIQGTTVSSTVPTAGQVIAYNNATSQYEPTNPSADWKLVGNAGTSGAGALGVASTNFVGTTDAKSLALATNGTTKAILGTDGSLLGGGGTLNSLTWGTNTVGATGTNAVALGNNNTASAAAAMALGDSNTANGANAFAIGKNSTAAANSFSIGFDSNGTANSNTAAYSGNIGFGNTVSGQKNFVYGINNVLSGSGTGINFLGGAYVFGSNNNVTGSNTSIVGYGNYTSASAMIYGNQNGTSSVPIKGGLTIGQSNTANEGLTIIGNTNNITGGALGNGVVIGSGNTYAGVSLANTNLYGNNYHILNNQANTSKVYINQMPTASANTDADLNVKATIKLGSTGSTLASASPCNSANAGTMIFTSDGNFYGCTGTTWKQLN